MGTIVSRGVVLTTATDTVSAWTEVAALPASTQVGDGLLVSVSKWILRTGTIDVTDSRLTLVYSGAGGNVYAGTATTLGPVTVSYSGFPAPATNESRILAATWQNRISVSPVDTEAFGDGADVFIRAPSTTTRRAGNVAVLLGEQQGDGQTWDGATGWAGLPGGGSGVDAFNVIAYTDNPSPPRVATSWQGTTYSKGMTVIVLGIKPLSSIAPPCRNLKRGDVLDLGGARNYPRSKMRQTSSRGVGAY